MKNFKIYAVILLILCVGLFVISGGRVIPPQMVDYYGRLITMEQLEQEGLELTCAPIRVSTLESWYRYWTYQPEWMCFDTDYELDHWMRSQGLLD